MELRRKKRKPLRTERKRMKEKKKVGRGQEQSQGGLDDLTHRAEGDHWGLLRLPASPMTHFWLLR